MGAMALGSGGDSLQDSRAARTFAITADGNIDFMVQIFLNDMLSKSIDRGFYLVDSLLIYSTTNYVYL